MVLWDPSPPSSQSADSPKKSHYSFPSTLSPDLLACCMVSRTSLDSVAGEWRGRGGGPLRPGRLALRCEQWAQGRKVRQGLEGQRGHTVASPTLLGPLTSSHTCALLPQSITHLTDSSGAMRRHDRQGFQRRWSAVLSRPHQRVPDHEKGIKEGRSQETGEQGWSSPSLQGPGRCGSLRGTEAPACGEFQLHTQVLPSTHTPWLICVGIWGSRNQYPPFSPG